MLVANAVRPGYKETWQLIHSAPPLVAAEFVDLPLMSVFKVVEPSGLDGDFAGELESAELAEHYRDAVGAAGGGTVHLPEGLYTVSPQDDSRAVLHIPHDDVLLRGEGPERTRIQTSTAEDMRQSAVILVGPEKAEWQSWHNSEDEQDQPAVPLTRDIEEPTRTLHVADTAPFTVGDWVILKADTTQEWLDEHPVLPGQQWFPTTFRALVYHRQITAVDTEAGTVEIDIPTRYRMLLRDGLRLHHHHQPTIGSGVADLAIGMRQSDLPHVDGNEHNTEGTQGWEAHGAAAVSFNNAVDSWVDNVASFRPEANSDDIHVLSGGVYIWYARSITVYGTTEGDLYATERVNVHINAQVRGNITAPKVGIEEGAKFKGSIEMDQDAVDQALGKANMQGAASQSNKAPDNKGAAPKAVKEASLSRPTGAG